MPDELVDAFISLLAICVYTWFKFCSNVAPSDANAVNSAVHGKGVTKPARVKPVQPTYATQRWFCSDMHMLLSNIVAAVKTVCADNRFSIVVAASFGASCSKTRSH